MSNLPHFSLKKVLSEHKQIQPSLTSLTEEMEWLVYPQKMLDYCLTSHGPEVLNKWQQLWEFEASGEYVCVPSRYFPNFHLADEVDLET